MFWSCLIGMVRTSIMIVEIGTHDELLKRRGHYYNLVKDQLELGD